MQCGRSGLGVLGLAVEGLAIVGLAVGPAIAATPPVVRAKSGMSQEPLCYIDRLDAGRQNLDATCLMGKPKGPKPFDMTTDRNGDGVPDDIDDFMTRMEALQGGTRDAAAATQMAQLFKELAERSPLSPDQKASLVEVGNAFRDLTPNRVNEPPEQSIARNVQAFERIGKAMEKVQNTPFMQKMNEFSNRRDANRRKQIEAQTSKPTTNQPRR
jgi:hypothetical protein